MKRRGWTGRVSEDSPFTSMGDVSIGRYPGPVWTMIAWSILSSVVAFTAVLTTQATSAETSTRVAVGVFGIVATAVLLATGPHTPTWLLHLLVISAIIKICMAIDSSAGATGQAVAAYGFIPVALYSASWFSQRAAYVYVSAASLAFLGTLALNGEMRHRLTLWIMVTSICAAIVALLGFLLRTLYRRATSDFLTGLLNRTGLDSLLDLRPKVGRLILPRVLVVIDLDGLKTVNDTQGHLAGDAVLREFGAALRRSLRADDILVRTGGDEFTLILPGTDERTAELLMDRLHTAASIAFSHGMADWPADASFDSTMAQADQRMYREKAQRRSG